MNRLINLFLALLLLGGSHVAKAAEVTTLTEFGVSTNGKFNYKAFEVTVAEDGAYHAHAWLLPSAHADKTYTTYGIYVNSEFVGTVTPEAGNWQSVSLADGGTIALNAGKNQIVIATPMPEVPQVETINVAAGEEAACIDSSEYDAYHKASAAGLTLAEPEVEPGISTYATPANLSFYPAVNLTYTLKGIHLLAPEDNVIITTTGNIPHVIDVVLVGTPMIRPVKPETSIGDKGFAGDNIIWDLAPIDTLNILKADDEEVWANTHVGISKKSATSATKHTAKVVLDVADYSYYFIRVHAAESGATGVVDLNINGDYTFDDEAISYTSVACVIPADGLEYASMTGSFDPDNDDPMIFVEGSDSKIMNYSSTATIQMREKYHLGRWDAYTSRKYSTPSARISVSNNKSSSPVSKCSILARISVFHESFASVVMEERPTVGTVVTPAAEAPTAPSINLPDGAALGSTLSISADDILKSASAYGIEGSYIGSVNLNDSEAEVPVSHLGISKPGIYILNVESATGSEAKRVVIR